MNLDLTSSNMSLISNAPPIEFEKYDFDEFLIIEDVLDVVVTKIEDMILSFDFKLEDIGLDPEISTELSQSEGLDMKTKRKKKYKSYYIRLKYENGENLFTIRISDHWNRRNKRTILNTTSFSDIYGENDNEVKKSIENTITVIKSKILEHKNNFLISSFMIEEIRKLI